MTDEFALDVAAALGLLATGIRTYQLVHARAGVPPLAERLAQALRAGEPARAREICEHAEGAAFTAVGGALLDALDAADPRAERRALELELRRAVGQAAIGVRKRVQSGRVRDLLYAFVLLGLVFYARDAGIATSPFFLVAAVAGALLAASGFVLRPKLIDQIETESTRLVQAALAVEGARSFGAEPCPACGSTEAIVANPLALGEAGKKLGLVELRICRDCGYVQGSVTDPKAIPVGAEHGTSLSAGALAGAGEAPAEDAEHDG